MTVFHAYQLLRYDFGDLPLLGLSERDGGDGGNHLMCVFETRCVNEQDFFISLNWMRMIV